MDTKWKKSKAVVGFICFLLGVSLLLEGGLYFGRIFTSSNSRAWVYDSFKSDWRRTREFQNFVSNRLERLIMMGAGGYVYGDINGYDGGDWCRYDTKVRSVQNAMKEDKNVLFLDLNQCFCFSWRRSSSSSNRSVTMSNCSLSS